MSDDPQDWRAKAAESDEKAPSSFYETVEIELLPGGRVRMDSPQDPFIFEVQFHPLTERRERKPSRSNISRSVLGADITEVQFIARPGERIEPIPLFDSGLSFAYFWALIHYLDSLDSGNPWLRLPARSLLPQQGKRGDPAFYRDLLALSEQLKLRGSMRPAAEIAERLEVNPNTVRTWLMRARKIRGEQR